MYKVTRLAKHRGDPLPRPVCRTWLRCSLIPHLAGSFCLGRDPLLLRRQFPLLEKTQSPLPVLATGLCGELQVPLPSSVPFLLLQFPKSPQRSSAVLSNSTPPFPTPMSAVEFLKPLLGGCSNYQGSTAPPARGFSFILGSVPHATSFRIPPWVVVVSVLLISRSALLGNLVLPLMRGPLVLIPAESPIASTRKHPAPPVLKPSSYFRGPLILSPPIRVFLHAPGGLHLSAPEVLYSLV